MSFASWAEIVAASTRSGPAPRRTSKAASCFFSTRRWASRSWTSAALVSLTTQDRPLDVPELLLDLPQLLFQAARGRILCAPERVEMPVHGHDQVAHDLGTQKLHPDCLEQPPLYRVHLDGEGMISGPFSRWKPQP